MWRIQGSLQAGAAPKKPLPRSYQYYGYCAANLPDSAHKGLAMLESGLGLTPIISHQFDLVEFNQGFFITQRLLNSDFKISGIVNSFCLLVSSPT